MTPWNNIVKDNVIGSTWDRGMLHHSLIDNSRDANEIISHANEQVSDPRYYLSRNNQIQIQDKAKE